MALCYAGRMSHASTSLPRFNDAAAFDAWALGQPGKWELHDGIPVAMSPERIVHAELKSQCWLALRMALRAKSLSCRARIDGPLVPGPGARRFQPDVTVSCGQRDRPDALVIVRPVILVEVLSPSTQDTDTGIKLESYFALPSVEHYLTVSQTARRIIHHCRLDGERLLTTIHVSGMIDLPHPGIGITVEDVYEDIELAEEEA